MYFTSTTFHSIPSNQQPFFSSIRPGAWGSKGGVVTDQCQLNSSNQYRTFFNETSEHVIDFPKVGFTLDFLFVYVCFADLD